VIIGVDMYARQIFKTGVRVVIDNLLAAWRRNHVLILYLALLGLQDNYWEFTQAILPALILLKLGYDYLNNEHNAQRQASIAANHIPSERSK
jgi:hypothetical protein